MAIAETPTRPVTLDREAQVAGRRLNDQQIGRLLVLPALIFAILVTQAPFLLTIWYSFQRWNLNRPDRRAFVGFDNYVFLLTQDASFKTALVNTVIFVVGAVLGSLALGLLYAELVVGQVAFNFLTQFFQKHVACSGGGFHTKELNQQIATLKVGKNRLSSIEVNRIPNVIP